MDSGQNRRDGGARPSRWGYFLAVVASALGHAALFLFLVVVLPALFQRSAPPPAYTVKIVDSIPAGDLGTHLPRLSQEKAPPPEPSTAEEETPEPEATPPPEDKDRNAIALNTLHQKAARTPTATMTPTPTPPPPPEPTPTLTPTPRPKKPHVKVVAPTPTATPTPIRTHHLHAKPSPSPQVAVAAAEPTPGIRQKLDKVRQQLLAEHLKDLRSAKTNEAEKNGAATASGGGPVVAASASAGKGYGVGPGNGSAGIQQDAGFLLYYQEVQKKIRAAWSFAGDNPDLTATVTFGINPDGSLNSIRVTESSRDPSFDDSVVRAIRRAAPFPPTPGQYRNQFADGLPAIFKLGDLQGGGNG
ncbi:MAG: TonB family protein [Candidatus Binataceae bacterium]